MRFSVNPIIIAITCLVYFLQLRYSDFDIIFGLNRYLLQGFYWQVLSTMFVHGGILHLLMNMAVLYQFGNIIEYNFGYKKYLLLYIVGGILTSAFSMVFMIIFHLNHNIVGASGAISVLIGFFAYHDKANQKGLVIFILLISIAPLMIGLNIAWYSHLIGFGLGFLVGKFIR